MSEFSITVAFAERVNPANALVTLLGQPDEQVVLFDLGGNIKVVGWLQGTTPDSKGTQVRIICPLGGSEIPIDIVVAHIKGITILQDEVGEQWLPSGALNPAVIDAAGLAHWQVGSHEPA